MIVEKDKYIMGGPCYTELTKKGNSARFLKEILGGNDI